MCPAHTCRDGQSVESLSRAMASVDSDGAPAGLLPRRASRPAAWPRGTIQYLRLLAHEARAFPVREDGHGRSLKRLRHGAAWKLLVNCVSIFMSLLYPHTIRSNILILLHASCFISLLCSVTLPGSSASPHRIEGARALISRCDSIPTSGPRQFNHGRARRRRTRRCRACPGTHRCTSPRCSTTAIGGPTSARWSDNATLPVVLRCRTRRAKAARAGCST